MSNNHHLFYATKQLNALLEEPNYTVKHFNSCYILEICKDKHKEGKLTKEELMELTILQRYIINS